MKSKDLTLGYLKNIFKYQLFLFLRYHLVAVVNFFAGHYTTYIRRISKNVWEIHNDLSQKIKIATSENEILHPHLLMYILA